MSADAPQPRELETPTTFISVRDDGIVVVRLKQGVEVDLKAAEQNHEATRQLIGERRFAVLVDARRARSITREARQFYADPVVRKYTAAQALLVDSPLSRVLGSFFLGMNKPPFPTRLFTSELDAIAWLTDLAT